MSKNLDLSNMLFLTVYFALTDGWAKSIQNT